MFYIKKHLLQWHRKHPANLGDPLALCHRRSGGAHKKMRKVRPAAGVRNQRIFAAFILCAVFLLLGITAGAVYGVNLKEPAETGFISKILLFEIEGQDVIEENFMLLFLRRFIWAMALIASGWSAVGIGLIPFIISAEAFRIAFTGAVITRSCVGGIIESVSSALGGEILAFLPFFLLLGCFCFYLSAGFARTAAGRPALHRTSPLLPALLLAGAGLISAAASALDLLMFA
jgi:hypothetical protein